MEIDELDSVVVLCVTLLARSFAGAKVREEDEKSPPVPLLKRPAGTP